MKTKLFLIATLICVIGFTTACTDKGINTGTDGGNTPVPPIDTTKNSSLAGTKWKLTAFVDVENDTRREPDYYTVTDKSVKDSMYLISFDNGNLASGKSFSNKLDGNYSADYNANILSTSIAGTKINEFGDGHLYWQILVGLKKSFCFKLYPQTLHLFYNDGKEYLEFNKIGELYEK